MKCPHCDYNHGWNNETLVFDEGAKGNFYHTPVPLIRDIAIYPYKETAVMWACPSCCKTFIEAE